MHTKGIRIVLIEDHTIIREGYRRLLQQAPDITVVGESGDGAQGAKLAAELRADVVILDLSLPGISGLETIKHIARRRPEARILVFTMHTNAHMVRRAMQQGARGYITKSIALNEMLVAIREVAKGNRYLDATITNELATTNYASHGAFSHLSPREFEIFKLVADGRDPKEIAATLSLSRKTVANYISQIKSKLDVSTTAELALLALQHQLLPEYVPTD